MQQGILPREIPKRHADAQPVFRLMQRDSSIQRSTETPRRRSIRHQMDAKRHSTLRDAESPHRRSIRLQVDAIRHSVQRIALSPHRISVCHQNNRRRMAQSRNKHNGIFKTSGLAFDYSPVTDYANPPELNIGMMDIVCRHCQALLYAFAV